MNISDCIVNQISATVAGARTVTCYREPVVGFARADDPRFATLGSYVPGHLAPSDLLPGAQGVCAFFLPFAGELVAARRAGDLAAWALAYVETNLLLAEICRELVAVLGQQGVRAAWEPPTHQFDPVRLVSTWSHKSVAVIAGLGRFGHHHMLITRAGCAGRLASVVLDVAVPPTPAAEGVYCAFDRGCRTCVRRCPVGALTETGLDRTACYAECRRNDARFPEWLADVCGSCAVGPCALQAVERI